LKDLIKQVVEEYWKSALALLVQTASISVIYEHLVAYFYLQHYTLPRSALAIILLIAVWGAIRFYRLKKKLQNYEFPKLSEDQEYILSMHKDLPLGNGQCASTLLDGQNDVHHQEAQYHLDILNNSELIEIINYSDLDEEEPLYRLTEKGRKYLYEKDILYKKWGA
jgi:DNA-binding transcriptional ArsR family regulator